MGIRQFIKDIFMLDEDAKRVERQLARKLRMPNDLYQRAKLISSRGFVSLNDHQVADVRHIDEMPLLNRTVKIDPREELKDELKRARTVISARLWRYRKSHDATEARLAEEWNNLQSVDAETQVELEQMASALTAASKPKAASRRKH